MDLFSAVYSSFCMGNIKINFFYYLSCWLRLLLIVCGPGSDKRVQILYSNIRGLHANLDELTAAASDYDVLVCAESKVSDRCHLLELRIPGVGSPNSGCGAQGIALYVRGGFCSFLQSKLECS